MSRVVIINIATARTRPPEPEHRRTHDKVRRASRAAGGKWEQEWSRRISYMEGRRIMLAARLHDEHTKTPGARMGALGLEALKVLELAVNMLRKTGRFDMAYETMAEQTKMARSCLANALKRLKAAGFLDWTRRFVATGQKGKRGPQCEQTSNLYRVSLPMAAAERVDKRKRRQPLAKAAPAPCDATSHEEARSAAAARYRALDEAERKSTAKASLDAVVERGLARGEARNAAAASGMNASPARGLKP